MAQKDTLRKLRADCTEDALESLVRMARAAKLTDDQIVRLVRDRFTEEGDHRDSIKKAIKMRETQAGLGHFDPNPAAMMNIVKSSKGGDQFTEAKPHILRKAREEQARREEIEQRMAKVRKDIERR